MQVGAAGEDRQGLVPGIAAHRRPQCNGVAAAAHQKIQVGTVGIVYQQRHTVRIADLCKGRDVLHPAEVVRAGEVDAEGGSPLPGQPVQRGGKLSFGHGAAAQRPGRVRRRPEPLDVKIQQRGGIEQRFVGVAGRQKHRALPGGGRLHRQAEHGPDALGRALGAVIGMGRAEEPSRVGLALGDDAIGLVQLIRAPDLGDVQPFKPQQGLPFMAGHVKAGRPGLCVVLHKVHDGRGHAHSQASPSAQALQVLPSSMGTSMPCAASS